jgi:hypothetical protein
MQKMWPAIWGALNFKHQKMENSWTCPRLKAATSSETFVLVYQSTLRTVPEDWNIRVMHG